MRKKVEKCIRTLIDNGVKLRHRSMFIIIGDKSRDLIVNLHYILNKSAMKSCLSVLWCSKEELNLSSSKGMLDHEKADPFCFFLERVNITTCSYRDTEKILGKNFGLCILQDFEALTPNLLARTIETVEGGGLIVLLLPSLSSLTSLYTMVMDVHKKFRTESHNQTASRFNERFFLSIAACKACVVMDDELNILPISSHIRSIQPVAIMKDHEGQSEMERELKKLKEQFQNDFPVAPLIDKCCTMDQGKALITSLDAILDKSLKCTVAIIASRGRGKSASLGLAVCGAIASGYSNIFVIARSPENLNTFFEFVCVGLNALEYKENVHYNIVKSMDPDMKEAIVQINVFKQHLQIIQYIKPHDHRTLSQVELLVIDEAAAIPLHIVKSMLGSFVILLSSTVNGYESSGRSLSLKLLQELESKSGDYQSVFRKIELNESIRYASGDPIESWLNGLLCLDVGRYIPNISIFPFPSQCNLYYVNRDTLFSYHIESELFLQRMMAIYVASDYKNSPDYLQVMADASSHHLFVLLGPVDETKNQLPDILCVVQVCLEGQISMSRKYANMCLRQGHQPWKFGGEIPWKFYEQYGDEIFPSLSGGRIVRIAVHPSALGRKYGTEAVELLTRYYDRQILQFAMADTEVIEPILEGTGVPQEVSLLEEKIMPKTNLPPLLIHLSERHPEKLHYLGVFFGLRHDLFHFWRKFDFSPYHIDPIPNTITGEYSCMMLKPLNNVEVDASEVGQYGFLHPFYQDFSQRFRHLLGSTFSAVDHSLARSILTLKKNSTKEESVIDYSEREPRHLGDLLSPHDMKRLKAYTSGSADYDMIGDLVRKLAHEYFQEKLRVKLYPLDASVFLCMGLQKQDISHTKDSLNMNREEVLARLSRVIQILYDYLSSIVAEEIESTLPKHHQVEFKPLSVSVDDNLKEGAREVKAKEKIRADNDGEEMFNPDHLQKYAIAAEEDVELGRALQNGAPLPTTSIVSVKSIKTESAKNGWKKDEASLRKLGKYGGGSKLQKKKHKKPSRTG